MSTDRCCGRCGQSDARVLDLDTGGAYHPNADCAERFTAADFERLDAIERSIEAIRARLSSRGIP